MAVIFKDEEVNPEILKKAAGDIAPRFPFTHSRLKKGFFWNYHEHTDMLPEIREESDRTLLPITISTDGRPDCRIVYYKRRLAFECAHHIGDGKGAAEYFNALVERYCELCDNPECEYIPSEVKDDELINAFDKYFQKNGEKPEENLVEAYHIPGKIEPGFLQLIFAMADVTELYTKAKAVDLTVTEFIASAVILATIRHAGKPVNDVISIAIPVNLRKFFPTDSIRNFTIQSKIDFNPEGKTDWTFEEITDKVRGQLKKRLTPEELQKTLNKFGSLANNPVIKLVPNFIKLPVMRMLQHKNHACDTTIVTNTGSSAVTPRFKERIERVDGVNGDTSGYGLISTCSVCSGNGIINLCFSVCSHDISWPKACISALVEQGISFRVESTHNNGEAGDFDCTQDKKCPECNVELSQAYETCPLCGSKAVTAEAKLKELKPAPYPVNSPLKPSEAAEKNATPFCKEKVKAFFNTK